MAGMRPVGQTADQVQDRTFAACQRLHMRAGRVGRAPPERAGKALQRCQGGGRQIGRLDRLTAVAANFLGLLQCRFGTGARVGPAGR